jgi:signal transduction histidine kinase
MILRPLLAIGALTTVLAGFLLSALSTKYREVGLASMALLPAALSHVASTLPHPTSLTRFYPPMVAIPYFLSAALVMIGVRATASQQETLQVVRVAAVALTMLASAALLARLARCLAATELGGVSRLALSGAVLGLLCLVLHLSLLGQDRATLILAGLCLPLGLAAGRYFAKDRRLDRSPKEKERDPQVSNGLSLDQVARGMAHALLKPIGAVLHQLKLLAAGVKEVEQRRSLESAVEVLEQAQRLVRDVLDLARAQRGPFQARRLSLASVVQQALESAKLRFPGSTFSSRVGGAYLCGDEVALRCMLMNLLENAAEAAGGRGRIEITSMPMEASIQLWIDDESGGVAEEIEESLFGAFVTTKPHGTGLGLALAREVCRAHGGDVRLERRGKGTRVVLVFPVAVKLEEMG